MAGIASYRIHLMNVVIITNGVGEGSRSVGNSRVRIPISYSPAACMFGSNSHESRSMSMYLREILQDLWESLPWPLWMVILGVIAAGWVYATVLWWPIG